MTESVKCEIVPETHAPLRRRPPGALSDVLMNDMCTGCGDCVAVCPKALLLLDQDGFPLLLSSRLCTHCGLCAEVCTPGAIEFTPRTRAALDRTLNEEWGAGKPH